MPLGRSPVTLEGCHRPMYPACSRGSRLAPAYRLRESSEKVCFGSTCSWPARATAQPEVASWPVLTLTVAPSPGCLTLSATWGRAASNSARIPQSCGRSDLPLRHRVVDGLAPGQASSHRLGPGFPGPGLSLRSVPGYVVASDLLQGLPVVFPNLKQDGVLIVVQHHHGVCYEGFDGDQYVV